MIHPEIKKFWQECGFSIVNEDQTMSGTVTGYKHNKDYFYIRFIKTLAFGNTYRFNGQWYSEEQMLRLVKLKAFL